VLTPAAKTKIAATPGSAAERSGKDERRPQVVAEALGTFVLVFGGTTAIVAADRGDAPVLLMVPFAFGLALLAGLYAFGEVSGGHFNPAVSLAMFVDRRLPSGDLIAYWIAQLAGAVLASLLLLVATSPPRKTWLPWQPCPPRTGRRSRWSSPSPRSSWR
jgi:glycerol uptake facilitator-like aquaporin